MTVPKQKSVPRNAGVALWRRIADDLRLDIMGGRLRAGEQLPTEAELARHFSANRHTVRRALAALAEEGVVRAEQGRGTFVDNARRLHYRIGPRTRFSEGLDRQVDQLKGALLSHGRDKAPTDVALALDVQPGAQLIRLETLALVDGSPFSRSTHWFTPAHFSGIGEIYAETGSITAALTQLGVPSYSRASSRITTRFANPVEISELHLSPGAVLLRAEGIDVDEADKAVQFLITRFPGDRVEIVV